MAFTTVTVTGTITVGQTDAPAVGAEVSAVLSMPVANGAVTVTPSPIVGVCDATGAFSVDLPAGDDDGTSPPGSFYTVTVTYRPVGTALVRTLERRQVQVAAADAPTVDWDSLTQVTTVPNPTVIVGPPGPAGPQGPPGVGSSGVIVRKFAFAYDTPGLATGATIYTPTIGDILLDAWVEIDTAWDGTTPTGDVGQLIDGIGWFTAATAGTVRPIDMTIADSDLTGASGILGSGVVSGTGNGGLAALSATTGVVVGLETVVPPRIDYLPSGFAGFRAVPAKFTSTNPVKAIVSRDGTTTGGDPVASQGAAILYLVISTPA